MILIPNGMIYFMVYKERLLPYRTLPSRGLVKTRKIASSLAMTIGLSCPFLLSHHTNDRGKLLPYGTLRSCPS